MVRRGPPPQGLEVRRERIRELIFDFYWNSKHSREAIEEFLIAVLDEAFSEPPSVDMEIEATEQWLCIAATEERAAAIWKAMCSEKRKEWE